MKTTVYKQLKKIPERQRRRRRRKGRPSTLHTDENIHENAFKSKYIDTNIEYVENTLSIDKN